MGRPKAFLPGPGGRPLIACALDALAAAGAAARLIAARAAEPFAALGVPVVLDAAPEPDAAAGGGPLAGIVAALRAAETDWCLVVACDMPTLDVALLRALAARAAGAAPHLAVVPEVEGRLEPLHALYHRSALPALEAALRAGRRSLQEVLRGLGVLVVPLERQSSFRNLNTPEDLAP